MKKPAANHHKTHKSPKWRTGGWLPGVGVPPPEFRCRPDVSGAVDGGAAPGEGRSRCCVRFSPGMSLNWTLRRYVRASSLRVWLRRHTPETGGATVPADRNGALRVAVRRTETAANVRSPALGAPPHGVSLSSDDLLRYRIHRNRQMEHLTQVAKSLRGGVRRGAAITPRECAGALDLVLATLGSRTCVRSNIFGFVMT
jgi:hypothetical protein